MTTNDTSRTSKFDYIYSICNNLWSCPDYQQKEAMVIQKDLEYDFCYILGRWNATIQPQYSSNNGGEWKFIYDNGMYVHTYYSYLIHLKNMP